MRICINEQHYVLKLMLCSDVISRVPYNALHWGLNKFSRQLKDVKMPEDYIVTLITVRITYNTIYYDK